MDRILRVEIESDYEKNQQRCPLLDRFEIVTWLLSKYETDGNAMRYLRRDGKTIAWKATPKLRKRVAAIQAEAEIEDEDFYD